MRQLRTSPKHTQRRVRRLKPLPQKLQADVDWQRGSAEPKKRRWGCREAVRLASHVVESVRGRQYYQTYSRKEILGPVYQSLQDTYTARKRDQVELSLKERTPGCNAKGTGPDKSGGHYYFPDPQHRILDSFCMKLGFSGSCLLGCGTLGLAAGVARLDARFGWLCWNCAWVDAASGGASSPMLFLLIWESRFMSRGLLPGWARVAPGLGRGSFNRWWSMGR